MLYVFEERDIHGSTRCPLGEISNWNNFVPGGSVRLISAGPQKCSCRLTMSRTALWFLMVLNPSSPGSSLSATTGVVKLSMTVVPFSQDIAIGSMQSCVHVWFSLPTPLSLKGLVLLFWEGVRPCCIAILAHSWAHLSPHRFATEPGSSKEMVYHRATLFRMVDILTIYFTMIDESRWCSFWHGPLIAI